METKLKQRVIGAVVLTTLAIIVLPMLLDGSAQDRARISANIPSAPMIDVKSLTIPQVKQAMLEMEQESTARLPVEIEAAEPVDSRHDTDARAFKLDVNEFRGIENPQLVVEQIAPLHDSSA